MAMLSSRLLFTLVSVPLLAAAAVIACGDDTESKTVPTVEGGTSSSGGGSSGASSGGSSGGSSGTSSSGGQQEEDAAPVEPDGGGPCGTYAFGKPAAPFETVDPDASTLPWDGGIPQGIYDVVKAERASGNPGSWRETFVVASNGRFSRVRQLDLGTDAGSNDITYRAGTMAPDGGAIYFTFDCAIDGDASVATPTGSIPYQLVDVGGEAALRFEFFGVRVTTDRR